jgi:hypothetical protein
MRIEVAATTVISKNHASPLFIPGYVESNEEEGTSLPPMSGRRFVEMYVGGCILKIKQ